MVRKDRNDEYSQDRNDVVKLPDLHREGDRLVVGVPIDLDHARMAIEARIDSENETVAVTERIDGFYWDAAYACYRAMKDIFGWVNTRWTPGMWGPTPPVMEQIEAGFANGVKQYVTVPQGRFSLPGVDGFLETSGGIDKSTGRAYFMLNGQVRRKHEHVVKNVATRARELLAQKSLYRGQVVRVKFKDADGEVIPQPRPEFIDVSKARPESIILNEDIKRAVETSLFTPIQHSQKCKALGIPLKRGVLLAGVYGTGKTMTAEATAFLAAANNWTFIYCTTASELAQVVRFAHNYQPAVVFCEDIDRELTGQRSVSMDEILNIIDGLDSKHTEIMTVLTTNHIERINKAMLRPGRLDAVIEFVPPDAKSAERLVRLYARGMLDADVDLTAVGEALAGNIPAIIRESVERAKLSSIKVNPTLAVGHLSISEEALLDAANSMQMHLKVLDDRKPPLNEHEQLLALFSGFIHEAVGGITKQDVKTVVGGEIKKAVAR